MNYPRPAYLDPSVKTVKHTGFFGMGDNVVPIPDYPISIKENFRRAAKRQNPVWVPNAMTDINATMLSVVSGIPEADWSRKDRYDWKDWFGVEWTFIPEAGGPMLKPGTQFMADITQWEKLVKFPNLEEYDFAGRCAKWLETCDPDKVKQVNIGLGCTERLVSLMGGYTDALCAMALEPEAVRDFLSAFVDFEIKLMDKLCAHLPLDLIAYHDDWGTERDTFFSEQMMEDIVYQPTKRLFDYIHSKGVIVQFHCCGNIKRFVPYQIRLGVDFLQIQARANDIPAFKAKWGDQIGFEMSAMPEGNDVEAAIKAARMVVDTYGKGGGLFSSISSPNPEALWAGVMELYYYSREKYEEEQGK